MPAAMVAKRRPSVGATAAQAKRAKLREARRRSEDLLAEAAPDVEAMRSAVHQFGIVEGEYDSKDMRLQQLLERLPAEKGAAVIFAEPSSQAAVAATMDRCRRRAVAAAAKQKAGRTKAVASMAQGEDVSEELLREWTCTCCTLSNGGLADACIACGARRGAFPRVTVVVLKHEASARAAQFAGVSCQLIINYDPPRSGQEYVRRLTALHESEAQAPAPPRVAYTFMEESELKSRVVREVAALLRSTRPHVPRARRRNSTARSRCSVCSTRTRRTTRSGARTTTAGSAIAPTAAAAFSPAPPSTRCCRRRGSS